MVHLKLTLVPKRQIFYSQNNSIEKWFNRKLMESQSAYIQVWFALKFQEIIPILYGNVLLSNY